MNQNFKKEFNRIGVTRQKLADALNVSSRTLRRLETGEVTTVSIDMLRKMRLIFGTDLNELCADDDNSGNTHYRTEVAKKDVVGESKEVFNKALYEENRYARHLEEENRWLREKYDELMNQLGHIRGNSPGNMRDSG